jgi:hypothetical protein
MSSPLKPLALQAPGVKSKDYSFLISVSGQPSRSPSRSRSSSQSGKLPNRGRSVSGSRSEQLSNVALPSRSVGPEARAGDPQTKTDAGECLIPKTAIPCSFSLPFPTFSSFDHLFLFRFNPSSVRTKICAPRQGACTRCRERATGAQAPIRTCM